MRLHANAGPPSGVWSGRGPPRLPLGLSVGACPAPTNPRRSLPRWRWWSDATAAAARASSCGACHTLTVSQLEKTETEKERPRKVVVEYEPEPTHAAEPAPSHQGRFPGAKQAGLSAELVGGRPYFLHILIVYTPSPFVTYLCGHICRARPQQCRDTSEPAGSRSTALTDTTLEQLPAKWK